MEKFNTQKNLKKKTIRYVERMIELIKFTHYPRTKEDIAKFLYEDNLMNKNKEINEYLKWDAKDENSVFQIFDTDIPVHFYEQKEEGQRKSTWLSGSKSDELDTIHPVFVALNATEVYQLTEVLLMSAYINDYEYFEQYKNIVRKIKKQLSPYMSSKINWKWLDKKQDDKGELNLKMPGFNVNSADRFSLDKDHDRYVEDKEFYDDYWNTIEDFISNVTYGTLENAVSLMKYMHLPKTRKEINDFMGMNVFSKEITLKGGSGNQPRSKQRGYWKSLNHESDYYFLNVAFPFCKALCVFKGNKKTSYVSTAGTVKAIHYSDDIDENANVNELEDGDPTKEYIKELKENDYRQELYFRENLDDTEEFDKPIQRQNKALYAQQSVHPIFLVLSMEEVYLLTLRLLALSKKCFKEVTNDSSDITYCRMLGVERDITGAIYNNIATKIYHQLSSYARNVLDEYAKNVDVNYQDDVCLSYLKQLKKDDYNGYIKSYYSERYYNRQYGIVTESLPTLNKMGSFIRLDTEDGFVVGKVDLNFENQKPVYYAVDKNGNRHKIKTQS
ncbi:hypothetical protein [Holdemanella biformis]|uniref:hypothetical protein n=1 Tax=Holdemanella biformis TaxID=1735 RepID=UPI00266D6CDA|nr:hypothetical protein [Holdemanella biformis]